MKAIINDMEYADVREAASLAGYSDEHVRRLTRQGKVAAIRQGPMLFISIPSLMEYVRKMKLLGNDKHASR